MRPSPSSSSQHSRRRRSRRSTWTTLIAVAVAVLPALLVSAQRTTYELDDGNTYIATIETDATGGTLDVITLSTILADTAAAGAATPSVADAETDTETTVPAVATPTPAAADPALTATNRGVVNAPQSLCTTAGCPVEPTVYTQITIVGGQSVTVIGTWTATTPTTPIPTWASSGSVQAIGQYITTTASGSRLAGAATRNSFRLSPPAALEGRAALAGVMAVVGGLVGAAIVL